MSEEKKKKVRMTASQKLMQEFRDVAEDLLSERQFGNPFILKKLDDDSSYDRDSLVVRKTYTEYEGNAVRKNYSAEQFGSLSNIINAGDVEFVIWMKDEDIVPIEGKDKIVFNEVEYNIIHVTEYNPNGSKRICHKCQSRRVQ